MAQIAVDGIELLVGRSDVNDGSQDASPARGSLAWGSYPMAPWAGRIRHGRFRYRGTDHELRLNQQDGPDADPERRHAMHGTVFDTAWRVDEQTETSATMSCSLTQPGSGWALGGTARQTIEILDGQVRCDLSIETDHASDASGADRPFLGEIGWHPWFRKPASVTFHPDAMYERDAIGLPTGHLVEPSTGPWDDCFVNTSPVTLHYERDIAPDVTVSSDCDHWVVYDEPAHATCVEPQSGPPDAFTIRPRLVTAHHPLRRTMNISW